MKILIAEDDTTSRWMLGAKLEKWGYEVVAASDGNEAWQALQTADRPSLAILDWNMPGADGLALCRRLREQCTAAPIYLILLTSREHKEDMVLGLQSGADDYITKPFDADELRARIQVGERVVKLQQALAQRISELQEAMAQINTLRGILPICAYCKKIRNDENYWQQLESYISRHSLAQFSHGICPECYEKVKKREQLK